MVVYHFPEYIIKDFIFCLDIFFLLDHSPGGWRVGGSELAYYDIQTAHEEAHVVNIGSLMSRN